MRTADFDYDLPSGAIAQKAAHPRDSARLLVVDRSSGQTDHRRFSDLVDYLHEGDVLVVNDTRVLPARLLGNKAETGGSAEVLLLRERYSGTWECLVKPGRRLKAGAVIVFGDGMLTGHVVEELKDSGGRLVRFSEQGKALLEILHELGEVPLPPYVTGPLDDPEDYQTVYGIEERSAAAPTAGLHFTEDLLAAIGRLGVGVARIELDIGLDTFRPVTEDDPHEHHIHSEHFRVSEEAAELVNSAHRTGHRAIVVGTTSVRALESAYDEGLGEIAPREGETDLFILPGHRFRTTDALVTNFHMPCSTLLMMVSAFAGRDLVMHAYESARSEGYSFLSLGDAMLFV